MNYIILDMEWDSAYFPYRKCFVNQILQIGAVKLNENFDIVSIFDVTVSSSFTKRVSKRFTELTGITKEDMLSGIPLEEAVRQYNSWIGDDTVTMTWSTSDLYTIHENEDMLLKNTKFKIDRYLDLQNYMQNEMRLLGHECKSQISLKNAAEILGVTTEGFDLHTAKDDSLLCAVMLKKYFNKKRFFANIKDTSNPEFYRRLLFKPYYINDLNSSEINKSDLEFTCDKCGKKLKRLTKWRFKNRNFCCEFLCNVCNCKFIARVSFRKNYDSLTVKRKLIEKTCDKKEQTDEMQPLSAKM